MVSKPPSGSGRGNRRLTEELGLEPGGALHSAPNGGTPSRNLTYDLPINLANQEAGVDPLADLFPQVDAVDTDDVNSALLRETVLGAMAGVHQRVMSGKFGKQDAEMLEKLTEIARQFPDLAKAIDVVQAYRAPAPSAVVVEAAGPIETSTLLQGLRLITGAGGKK